MGSGKNTSVGDAEAGPVPAVTARGLLACAGVSLPLASPSPPQDPALEAQPHQGWNHKHDSLWPCSLSQAVRAESSKLEPAIACALEFSAWFTNSSGPAVEQGGHSALRPAIKRL